MEPLQTHLGMSSGQARTRAIELLELVVGIPSPEVRMNAYAHEFSGGMRQRAMIATALSCNPKLLIANEPTSALDVTIQRQILDLMQKLCKETGTGIILITHDVGVVAETCDRVVMYAGREVESGPTHQVLTTVRPTFWSKSKQYRQQKAKDRLSCHNTQISYSSWPMTWATAISHV